MKKSALLPFVLSFVIMFSACTTQKNAAPDSMLLLAAAASLEKCFKDELIPMFTEIHPDIAVEGSYDASGKLQTQIEEGLDADLFVPASLKNIDALVDGGMVDGDSVVDLLENRIVLITSKDSAAPVETFDDITNASVIAIGDPESVPAGAYAKEILENLGMWDSVSSRLSLGTNVTEVLAWVGEKSADVGIVYATDAAGSENVRVIAEAPEGSLKSRVIYPAGIVSASRSKDAARLFLEFLQSAEARTVFENYGFSIA